MNVEELIRQLEIVKDAVGGDALIYIPSPTGGFYNPCSVSENDGDVVVD